MLYPLSYEGSSLRTIDSLTHARRGAGTGAALSASEVFIAASSSGECEGTFLSLPRVGRESGGDLRFRSLSPRLGNHAYFAMYPLWM